ncbi:hypothetical protein L7F22_020950 [Adiantum nelumboides]|nr:hypothetical protein [Adiantum nelumboides]
MTNANSREMGNAGLPRLQSVRDKLDMAMQRCLKLEDNLRKTGPRLQQIAKRIPSLEVAFKPLRSHRKVLDDLPSNIDKAVGPASAVLKVFDAMHDLEHSLLDDPQHDLIGYISLISRLEEAICFLSQNCPMAVEWLQEFVDFLDHNQVLQIEPMKRVSSHLKLLQACQSSGDWVKLDGGLHAASLDRLEGELERILSVDSLLHPHLSTEALRKPNLGRDRKIPSQVLKSLHLIVQKLASNGRTHRSTEIYIEARVRVFRESMRALPLNYLHIKSGTKVDWKSIGMYIGPWTQHMEVVVKSICEPEYALCSQVFEKFACKDWEGSYGKVVVSGGLLELLQFGEVAVKSTGEPQKLFKLLDMFEAMTNLRSLFGRLFGGPGCMEVHQRTKSLLKLIVQGAHDIFLELKQQIENQRASKAPIDGSLPKVLSFVLGYVKHLVGDFYGPIMTKVLVIYQSWKDDVLDKTGAETLLSKAVLSVMNALVLNVNEWAKSFKGDPILNHLFLCNNLWYLAVSCRASELKVLLGESWLREQQQQAEGNISMYMKEGWAKIVQHLNIPGVMTLTGSRAAARDLLKTKLKAFNAAFEELYQKHVKWTVVDAELRERIGVKVLKLVVPAYRTYLQNYGPLLEQDGAKSKYVKYSAQSLERILGSLFQGPSERIISGSDKKLNGSAAIVHPTTVSVV